MEFSTPCFRIVYEPTPEGPVVRGLAWGVGERSIPYPELPHLLFWIIDDPRFTPDELQGVDVLTYNVNVIGMGMSRVGVADFLRFTDATLDGFSAMTPGGDTWMMAGSFRTRIVQTHVSGHPLRGEEWAQMDSLWNAVHNEGRPLVIHIGTSPDLGSRPQDRGDPFAPGGPVPRPTQVPIDPTRGPDTENDAMDSSHRDTKALLDHIDDVLATIPEDR